MYEQQEYGQQRRGGGMINGSLLIAIAIAGISFFRYCSNSQINPMTGETQHISLTKDQEIQMGLQSAPAMAQEFGGLHPDQKAQALVKQVGHKLVQSTNVKDQGYEFDFHLLSDPNVVNAFALPGGQIFITAALFSQLENEDQLAGVLGHEVGHVVARHAAERISKDQLMQGLISAAVVGSGDMSTAQMAQYIGSMITMKYGRDQELQSDDLGVRLMIECGYDPEQMIGVMEILKRSAGGRSQSEFFSTHPDPENRMEKIKESIQKYRAAAGVK